MTEVTATKVMVAFTKYLQETKTDASIAISKSLVSGRGAVHGLWESNEVNKQAVLDMLRSLATHGYFDIVNQKMASSWNSHTWYEGCFRITEKGKAKVRELYKKQA